MRKRFKFYFREDAAKYYTVTAGSVTTASIPTAIVSDPPDWNSVQIQWERSKPYHGVFRSFVAPLSFVKDGAAILRRVLYTQGPEARLQFVIERLDSGTQRYMPYYIADVDMSRAIDDREVFQVILMQGGLPALLMAKADTPIETPILNLDSMLISMDGVTLQSVQTFTIIDTTTTLPAGFNISNIIPSAAVSLEGYAAGATKDQPALTAAGITPDLATDYIYQATRNQTLTLSISDLSILWTIDSSFGAPRQKIQVWLRYGQGGGSFTDVMVWSSIFVVNGGFLYDTISGQVTIPLNGPTGSSSGQEIALYFFFTDNSGTFINKIPSLGHLVKILDAKGKITITTTFRPDPIPFRGLRYLDMVKKHVSAMSGGQYGVVSNYLNTPSLLDEGHKPYNVVVSSGDAMRRLGNGSSTPTAPRLVMTMDEIREDLFSRDMVGIGVEGDNIRIEKLSYFYDRSKVLFTLRDVKKPRIRFANELLYNLFEIGYKPQSNDDIGGSLNGRYDYHNTLTFASAGIKSPKTFSAISPFIASMYAINFICFNLAGKSTTDTKNDNSTYLIEVNDNPVTLPPFNTTGIYTLARRQNLPGNSASGVLDPSTAFNAGLSPKHNFNRLSPLLHAHVYQQDGTTLTYQTADKNPQFQSNLGGGSGNVVEKANVPVASLPSPPFIPYTLEFITAVSHTMVDQIDANPNGCIEVVIPDKRGVMQTVAGFIQKANVQDGDNAAQSWVLILAPDTNLSMFI